MALPDYSGVVLDTSNAHPALQKTPVSRYILRNNDPSEQD